MCVWLLLKKPAYFTIQLIFATIYGSTTLFCTIHESHYIISVNFYFYLQYCQQKKFSFIKITGSQKFIFANLFYYSTYFCCYSWVPLHFLVIFMSLTILFQLTFIFIYNTFNNKFSVSVK